MLVQCCMSILRKSPCRVANFISHATRIHVACRFLRKACVALSNLGVKGHRLIVFFFYRLYLPGPEVCNLAPGVSKIELSR